MLLYYLTDLIQPLRAASDRKRERLKVVSSLSKSVFRSRTQKEGELEVSVRSKAVGEVRENVLIFRPGREEQLE